MPDDSELRKFIVPQEFATIVDGNPSKKIVLLNSNESELTLGADEAQNVQIATAYLSLKQITESCTAIQNPIFNPVTPKPKWYEELQDVYKGVQTVSNKWNTDLAAEITNSIPRSVLAFVPLFSNVTSEINEILKKYAPFEDIKSEKDRKNIASGLSMLIKKTDDIVKNVTLCEGKLKAWINEFSKANGNLKKKSDIIITEKGIIDSDKKTADDLKKKCSDEIEKYKTYVGTGQVLVGVGSGIVIAGLGLLVIPEPTFVTKLAGGILVGVGVLLTAGGAISWGVYEAKVKEARREIAKQEDKIRQLDGILAALTALSLSVSDVQKSADKAIAETITFLTSWNLFNGELKNLKERLEDSTDKINSSEIRANINTAKEHWKNSYEFSKGLLGLTVKPIEDPVAKTEGLA